MAMETRFPKFMRIRVPDGMSEAVRAAARAQHQGSNEWVRRVILGGLESQGVHLTPDGKVEQHPRGAQLWRA
jgi:hypothetical protein